MVPANSNLFDAAPTLPVMQVILAIACTAHFVAEATVCTHPSAQGPLCLFLARPRPPGRVSNLRLRTARAPMVRRRITLRGCLRPTRLLPAMLLLHSELGFCSSPPVSMPRSRAHMAVMLVILYDLPVLLAVLLITALTVILSMRAMTVLLLLTVITAMPAMPASLL